MDQKDQPDHPARVQISPDGVMTGRTGRYTKHLGDMDGVYRDAEAYRAALAGRGPDELVYQVDSQDYGAHEGALTIGTSTLLPGRYGQEFAVTRGHLHRIANRAELYHCLSGHGVMLLETLDGQTEAVELTPGVAVNVPGDWIHRSVNVGDQPFVTLFTYATDAGQDYELIARAGGMKALIVDDGAGGWKAVPNPDHRGYTESR
ncbi:glucose-6-phosphate isomerase family protein [Sediminivirga luteola]|uniref:glucose-6-phosphate isomerase family protein n=1 Tax=Sediminivirga luteola TaxID=1774748 RepID=UPI001F5686FA|nr:glucose-6-phosphate isomerase family protein [Sediminivirga luteola]MCI2264971.1 glucose-6-phosphate isomerase [Sediminivirga luteola]